MHLKYKTYNFTPILGWSTSRFEVFDKCKRQYFYQYYAKYVKDVPTYKMQMLKALTSVPLEIGNVIHDVIEAFLRRLQKSDSDIDESRFYEYARHKAQEYCSHKTFMEVYYKQKKEIDLTPVYERIDLCLQNFLKSPIYSWIFMKAMCNRDNWMIEPEGYGETRLDSLKAYCKMDFLFPVDDHVYILDWKTGKRDEYKHKGQLLGYAAAASSNFNISWKVIFPKIVYLSPEFSELEIPLNEDAFSSLFTKVKEQTEEMYSYCKDKNSNVPKEIEAFPKTPSTAICRFCNYQELCFPEIMNQESVDFNA